MRRFAPLIATASLFALVVAIVVLGPTSSTIGQEAAPTVVPTVAGQESTPAVSQPASVQTATSAPTVVPAPEPTPTPKTIVVVHPYQYSGNPSGKYFGLEIKSETTIYAPFDGTVGVVLVDKAPQGRLPQGKIFVRFVLVGGDKSIFSLALGEIGSDVILLAKNETKVKAGDQLFTVVDFGPSFWKYTDDPNVNFQTVGYLKDSSGAFLEVDATFAKIFLKGRS